MKKIINICAGLLLGMSIRSFSFQLHNDDSVQIINALVAPGQQRIFNVCEILRNNVQLQHATGPSNGVLNVAWPLLTYQPNVGFQGQDALVLMLRDAENREMILAAYVTIELAKP